MDNLGRIYHFKECIFLFKFARMNQLFRDYKGRGQKPHPCTRQETPSGIYLEKLGGNTESLKQALWPERSISSPNPQWPVLPTTPPQINSNGNSPSHG